MTSRRLCIFGCPLRVQRAHERMGHGVRDGGYHKSDGVGSLSPRLVQPLLLLTPSLPAARPALSPHVHCSSGSLLDPCLFCLMETAVCPPQNHMLSRYDSPSLFSNPQPIDHPIQKISSDTFYDKRSITVDTQQENPLIILVAQKRWLHRALGWPAKGSAKAPA